MTAMNRLTNFLCRSWHVGRVLLPTQPDYHLSSVCRQRGVLVPYCLVLPPDCLPLGLSYQHHVPLPSGDRCFGSTKPPHQLCPGLFWSYHFFRLRRHSGTDFLHHHLRDLLDSPSSTKYRCWPSSLLHHGDPYDLPFLSYAQHYRLELGW